eukprot:CAMPEP_0180270508 /NCGR_PEP_ID=MMETSP0988-20121125/3223_1 /TAXON_ID=697907 /ORGANISM="non described non described, Strain CCMP2293" /LENGTH=73 /DNA_ID=CAMNT_0022241465 /DNA_START=65 /DNA_END=283 /DNA_ORIENTATION=-
MFLFPGIQSHSYNVGGQPWKRVTSLAGPVSSAPTAAPAGKGGMGTGFYAGYEAGKRKGQGLDGVIAGAAAAYY